MLVYLPSRRAAGLSVLFLPQGELLVYLISPFDKITVCVSPPHPCPHSLQWREHRSFSSWGHWYGEHMIWYSRNHTIMKHRKSKYMLDMLRMGWLEGTGRAYASRQGCAEATWLTVGWEVWCFSLNTRCYTERSEYVWKKEMSFYR